MRTFRKQAQYKTGKWQLAILSKPGKRSGLWLVVSQFPGNGSEQWKQFLRYVNHEITEVKTSYKLQGTK